MTTAETNAVAGMREVTKDEFYAHVGPMDVTCNLDNPTYTVWETRNRTVVGRSYPGWRNPGDQKSYWLR